MRIDFVSAQHEQFKSWAMLGSDHTRSVDVSSEPYSSNWGCEGKNGTIQCLQPERLSFKHTGIPALTQLDEELLGTLCMVNMGRAPGT